MTDPLITAARFLQSQLEWMRHAVNEQGEPYAVTAFAEIDWCAGRLRGLVNGPSEKRYLGPCGAEQPPTEYGIAQGLPHGGYCAGDMYVRGDASIGRCGTCKATVSRADREAWLDGEVRAHAFRAAQIAEAYRVNVNTIRSWAGRGQLKSYWRTTGGLVIPWTEVAEENAAERLHYVGDVLDLAAADAARRETERAKRERRAATRAAETEDAA